MRPPLPFAMDPSLQQAAEAAAFRSLVAHLRACGGAVQNIELMNLAGFCRNCLAKWYLAGARRAGAAQLTYDDACVHVYGEPYAEWKKKHQKKATPEQLAKFEQMKAMHAQHDKELLKDPPVPAAAAVPAPTAPEALPAPAPAPPLAASAPSSTGMVLSDVCCEPEAVAAAGAACAAPSRPPARAGAPLTVGVVTVSDRAASGFYEDESGPEVQRLVQEYAPLGATLGKKWVTPDDQALIQESITSLVAQGCSLVLTTGGTGLAPRDVTPEATRAVLDKEAPGIMELVRRETAKVEPRAGISRGIAGTRGGCLIINLPGRPKAVRETLGVLLPLLPHAVAEVTGANAARGGGHSC